MGLELGLGLGFRVRVRVRGLLVDLGDHRAAADGVLQIHDGGARVDGLAEHGLEVLVRVRVRVRVRVKGE